MKKYLIDTHPEIAQQLVDPALGKTLTYGSRKKVEWQCDLDHKWIADCNSRTGSKYPKGCAVCGNRKVLVGFNDLATKCPKSTEMWSDKNNFTPYDVTYGSEKLVYLNCPNGHEFKARINNVFQKGTGCRQCLDPQPSGREAINATRAAGTNPIPKDLMAQWAEPRDINLFSAGTSTESVLWKCKKGHEWRARPADRVRGTNCPRCSKVGTSKAEIELADYVESLGLEVVRNSRSIISPRELDIYVPEKKIAVEYNGLYWHTEDKVGRSAHYDKWVACKNAGIQLISVWEDDYASKPTLIQNMLKAKLGFVGESVGARKTQVIDIDVKVARKFLDKNHIQGFTSGSWYKGLQYNGELVAVAVFKKNKDVVYLQRYASALSVVGGMMKMLHSLPPAKFITFADHEVSNGRLYELAGWKMDKELSPDYKYFYEGKRHHKFGFRLKRFKQDPKLIWQNGMSESQLAGINGIERIYDSGKTKYIYERK